VISIIIPTRNRAHILEKCLNNLQKNLEETETEVVVIDNNSSDSTAQMVAKFGNRVRLVKEPNTSFSKARKTGREGAKGSILLFIDDDTLVRAGALKALKEIFTRRAGCGLVAGRIIPEFEENPPEWVENCQKQFNGLSVFNESYYPALASGEQETVSACGPMLAVRSEVYDQVGGFPPDTIGVETDQRTRTFRKLYVGPGDYGLCHLTKNAGYQIWYDPKASCRHWVPKIRNTLGFWRSRLLGEGHHQAITERMFFKKTWQEITKNRQEKLRQVAKKKKLLIQYLKEREPKEAEEIKAHPLELEYLQAIGYLEMENLLKNNGYLAKELWNLATDGISDNDAQNKLRNLPDDVFKILANDRYYSEKPMTLVDLLSSKWEEFVPKKGILNKILKWVQKK